MNNMQPNIQGQQYTGTSMCQVPQSRRMHPLMAGAAVAVIIASVTAAAGAAQNEALNNYLSAKQEKGLVDSLKTCAPGDTRCVQKWTSYYASVNVDQQQATKLGKCIAAGSA